MWSSTINWETSMGSMEHKIYKSMLEYHLYDWGFALKNKPEPTTEYYFECHITLSPVFSHKLDTLKRLTAIYDFRVADLWMQKGEGLAWSDKDAFCTGRDKSYSKLYERMTNLVNLLTLAKYEIRRAKIENILYDVKYPSKKVEPEIQ